MEASIAESTPNSLFSELETLQLMLDASIDCIKLLSPDGRLLKVNLAGRQALGLMEPSERQHLPWLQLLPKEVRAVGQRALKKAAAGKKSSFIGRSELPGQAPVIWENILTPIFSREGVVASILCLSRDITRQSKAEKKLKESSLTDPLTNLPNRRAFYSHANSLRRKHLKKNLNTGLLLFDIDNFKGINDNHGHECGDEVLRKVCTRLHRRESEDEYMARLGGDEFVLLAAIKDEQDLQRIAHRMIDKLQSPIVYRGTELNVGISIGGAIFSDDLGELHQVLKESDTAMYAAKLKGKSNFHITQREGGPATSLATG